MQDYCTAVYSASCHADEEVAEDKLYNVLKSYFSRYSIKLNLISDAEAIQHPELLSDPFLLFDSLASIKWIERMDSVFHSYRKITNKDISAVFPGLSTVVSDNTENVCTCLTYLKQLDAKKIAFFGFDSRHFTSLSIIQTFLRFAEKMDITMHAKDVFWNTDTLEATAEIFLPVCQEYDALITVNAGSAVFITQKLLQQSIRIPEDMKIICMRDKKILSMMTPSISAFEVSEKELSMQVLHAYQFLRKYPTVRRMQIHVGSIFYPRASTGFAEFVKALPASPVSACKNNIPESGYKKINPFIEFFENCDKTDFAIIRGLMDYKMKADIAEKCFLSPSTLSYRLQKILEKTKMDSTEEMLDFIKDYHIL